MWTCTDTSAEDMAAMNGKIALEKLILYADQMLILQQERLSGFNLTR